jgi:hypothetical protein
MREESKTVEAMKMALEAFEKIYCVWPAEQVVSKAREAIDVAIAEASMQQLTDVQQEMEAPRVNQCAEVCERAKLCAICARGLEEMGQEPVAWKDRTYGNLHHQDFGNSIPLFTHPPRREWVGLTEQDVIDLFHDDGDECFAFSRAIEAKLKEKNS